MRLRLAVPDLLSNSYFPAVAACELGFFARQGLDVSLELLFPVSRAYEALRDGQIHFVAGSAHSAVSAFPQWRGVQLLCAQGQGMYWFLVLRPDLAGDRGDLSRLKGCSIGAAPWVELGLRQLLVAAGFDLERDQIRIDRVPGAVAGDTNFGVTAAKALADGRIDGFWANGMGAAVAVRDGAGVIVLDARRGDGPKECFNYTMASVATTRAFIDASPQAAAAAIRAIVETQQALKRDVSLAAKVARKLFPASEAELIVPLIERDLPYYDASISPEFVRDMSRFSRSAGILETDVAYEDVVAMQFTELWRPAGSGLTTVQAVGD